LEIDINKLVQMITAQVISELQARGMEVNRHGTAGNGYHSLRTKSEIIDMKKYRSPVLTEDHIRRLHELTGEVIVPKKTVLTPKARELVKNKQITVTFQAK